MDVKDVAKLACLDLTTEEAESLDKDLSQILNAFEKLSSVNTDGVQPLFCPTEISQNLRKDEVVVWESSDDFIENAPEVSGKLFKVPPVV